MVALAGEGQARGPAPIQPAGVSRVEIVFPRFLFIYFPPFDLSTLFDVVRPFDKLRDHKLTNRAQGPSSRLRKFRDLSISQFVEPAMC